MKDALRLFLFAKAALDRGERVVLVTIAKVIGSASRAPGTHMMVCESGVSCGSFSGGCVEAAVVAEALRILQTGRAEQVRFGVGSPYLDIRLPCGGGLDLLFHPEPPSHVVRTVIQDLEGRRPVALRLHRDGRIEITGARQSTGWMHDAFVAVHVPDPRIIIIGQGAEAQALRRIAFSYGAQTVLLSPDETLVGKERLAGRKAELLKTPAPSPHLNSDPYSAVVLLFHDHDWEVELLEQALEQPSFFIGAMGSRRTHAHRMKALQARGVSSDLTTTVVGPVGLIPKTRDPDTLALSIMAQIAQRFEEALVASPGDLEHDAWAICA